MIRHVKIIAKSNLKDLEKAVNDYLVEEIEEITGTTNGDQVEDIKFSAGPGGFYALLTF
jgi:hypothetical protein